MKTRSKSAKEKGLKPLTEASTNKAVKFVNEPSKLEPDKLTSKSVKELKSFIPLNVKKRSRSETSSAANNASQSTAGTLPVEQQTSTNQRKRSHNRNPLPKVEELPEATLTERSPACVEKADNAESVGELEDGSGVSIKIIYNNP